MLITRRFSIEMAHRLFPYKGPCKNLHGHSMYIEVTLEGKRKMDGMVVDFKNIKEVFNNTIHKDFDHSLIVSQGDPHAQDLKKFGKVNILMSSPTSEHLAEVFFSRFKEGMAKKEVFDNVTLKRIKIWETENCHVSYPN